MRYNTFTTGGADITEVSQPDTTLPQLLGSYAHQNWKVGISTLAINTKTGPTADLPVRQALVYGVDMAGVIARSTPGAEQVLTWIPKGSLYYNGIKTPGYDLLKAKAAMASYLHDTGQSSVTIPLDIAPNIGPVGTAIKQDWDKVPGLNVVVNISTAAATSAQIAARNYKGLLNAGLTMLPAPAKPVLLSTSPQDLTFLNDPTLDTALTTATASPDPAVQKAQMQIVTEQLNQQLPYVVQFATPWTMFQQKTVQGIPSTPA